MDRSAIRQMKRVIAAAGRAGVLSDVAVLAEEAALSLLERSILFGHGRLAVIRLVMAVHAGADVPQQHWTYCREVAAQSKDLQLRGLFLEAAQAAAGRAEITVDFE